MSTRCRPPVGHHGAKPGWAPDHVEVWHDGPLPRAPRAVLRPPPAGPGSRALPRRAGAQARARWPGSTPLAQWRARGPLAGELRHAVDAVDGAARETGRDAADDRRAAARSARTAAGRLPDDRRAARWRWAAPTPRRFATWLMAAALDAHRPCRRVAVGALARYRPSAAGPSPRTTRC